MNLSEYERALLEEASAGDQAALEAMLSRVEKGEPPGYVAGFIRFCGHRFRIDPRAYITDPEAERTVAVVVEEGDALARQLGGPISVLEFGTGAATQVISVAKRRPAWRYFGLDVDPPALELGAENAADHGCDVQLFVSDYLSGWTYGAPPDLLFADPPWGSEEDLYADDSRDASYYHAMPAVSAYPQGGRTAIHDELVRRLVSAKWPSLLVLNYGVIPLPLIEKSVAPLARYRLVSPAPGHRIVVGQAV